MEYMIEKMGTVQTDVKYYIENVDLWYELNKYNFSGNQRCTA